jgi:hypothetical protein
MAQLGEGGVDGKWNGKDPVPKPAEAAACFRRPLMSERKMRYEAQ